MMSSDAGSAEQVAPHDFPSDDLVTVLYEPQDLVNIAGVVRAMSNMGLRRLRLVHPAEYDEYRILGIAHQGRIVLEQTTLHDSLEDAVRDTSYVVGTSARRRTARFVWRHPRAAAPDLVARAAAGYTVAVVFGREDIGLENEQLDLCDLVLTVPTDPLAPSLNLAQAVLIVCYELWLAGAASERPLPRPRRAARPASWEQHQQLFGAVESALYALDFFKKREPSAIMRTLRAVARRARLDAREANLLRAMAFETRKVIARARRAADAD